jgi:hypothetical protein
MGIAKPCGFGTVRPTHLLAFFSQCRSSMSPARERRSLIDNPAFLKQLESLDDQPLLSGFASESIDEKEMDGRCFEPIWPEIRKKEPRGFSHRLALMMFILMMVLVGAGTAALLVRAGVTELL